MSSIHFTFPKMIKMLIFLIICGYAAAQTPQYRLPEGAVNVNSYDIQLRVDAGTFTAPYQFDGTTTILFTNVRRTNEIKLHANKMNISSVILKSGDGHGINLENTNFISDSVTDILTINAATPLTGGADFLLEITFKALFRTDEMYGFYRSTYAEANGIEKVLGTTQFQPTHARKAFPCFDEPFYKAEFDLGIRHPIQYNALGNTQASRRTDPADQNFAFTTFATTPRMSTYLLAFVVSEFTCGATTPIQGGGVHSVCSRNEAAAFRQTAEEAGPPLIQVMQSFTGINYAESGMTKMHQVAIPDFSAGAMENWGLLTYRETGLLWDPAQSTNSQRQSLKNVVAHEIAHMWFGNLVTTHWWSDTFLNEGFARYFQYFATAQIEPSWELDRQFVIAQLQAIFVSDAQPTAVALSAPANSPSEASNRFASVSYNKGASVLRMLLYVMGENNFKSGIQQYLRARWLNSTTPEDLWTALQEFTTTSLPPGTPLSVVMNNWIKNPGFPVLKVDANGSDVTITQERFLVSGTPGANEKWYVPVTYTLSSEQNKFENTAVKQWLLPTGNVVLRNVLNEGNDWIILNNQQIGYYRVNYAESLWTRIETALNSDNFGGIHVLNRAQLVDDAYNLARVGTRSYSTVFQLFRFLRNETSYHTWSSAINAISNMMQRTTNQRITNSISTMVLELIDTVYKSVPFKSPNNDNQIYTLNRVQAITWACRLGHAECVENAVASFKNYTVTKVKPDKNLKSVIYCNGLRHSTAAKADWDFLWGEYGTTSLATEKTTILNALGCSRNKTVLTDYLFKSIDATSGIKQQDASSVFSTVYTQNPEGVDIAFDFLLENYRQISTYYGSMNSLSNLFSGLAGRFTTQAQIDKLNAFLTTATDLTESLKTSATTALENAKANLVGTEVFEKELTAYFNLDINNTADSIKVGFISVVITIFVLCYQLY